MNVYRGMISDLHSESHSFAARSHLPGEVAIQFSKKAALSIITCNYTPANDKETKKAFNVLNALDLKRRLETPAEL